MAETLWYNEVGDYLYGTDYDDFLRVEEETARDFFRFSEGHPSNQAQADAVLDELATNQPALFHLQEFLADGLPDQRLRVSWQAGFTATYKLLSLEAAKGCLELSEPPEEFDESLIGFASLKRGDPARYYNQRLSRLRLLNPNLILALTKYRAYLGEIDEQESSSYYQGSMLAHDLLLQRSLIVKLLPAYFFNANKRPAAAKLPESDQSKKFIVT